MMFLPILMYDFHQDVSKIRIIYNHNAARTSSYESIGLSQGKKSLFYNFSCLITDFSKLESRLIFLIFLYLVFMKLLM